MAWAEFTDNHYKFFKDEFGFDRAEIDAMDDDAQNDVYERCIDIEIEEAMKHADEELSERGKMASHLVDFIHGPYDSTEYDAEMADADDDASDDDATQKDGEDSKCKQSENA